MKLSLLLTILTTLHVSASLYSQGSKLNLSVKNLPVKEVLKMVENKTSYRFFYSDDFHAIDQNVTVDLKNMKLEKALALILEHTSANYKIMENNIVIISPFSTDDQKVTGIVTDASTGEPLIGVNITIKDTTLGVVSGLDGSYSIDIYNENTVLVFSYVGYLTENIPVVGKSVLNIKLMPDITKLDEVVVIGYGVQNKRDISTSIVSVKSKDMADIPTTDFRQALAGKMAGVHVMQTSGNPEGDMNIRIRGIKSATAGNDPLYIIDGIPVERGFESINSNDIESVEVLKDASAAAIYGSRGSNGVILITSKQGKTAKSTVTYDGYYGIQKISHKIPMLNAYQYAELVKDGHDNAYLDVYPNGSKDDPNSQRPSGYMQIPEDFYAYLNGEQGLTDTDWQDAIFRTGSTVSHNVSVSGKSKNTNYYISGGYYKKEGIIICSDFERYSLRINLDGNTGKFKYGINFTPSYSHSNKVNTSSNYTTDGITQAALFSPPTLPIYNKDGSYNFDGNGYYHFYEISDELNPVALANEVDDVVDRYSMLGKIYGMYEFTKDLSFTTSLGGDFYNTNESYYRPSTIPLFGVTYYKSPSNPTSWDATNFYYNWQFENKLIYNKVFGEHHINTVLVYAAEKANRKYVRVDATDYPNDFVRTISGGTVNDGNSEISGWSLASWLSRIQYNYKGKYMLSAALRSDGSSRFGKNNRWGYFPSASAAWRISDEKFMKKIFVIDDLKIRASYGQTGNFQIGNYEHLAGVSVENYVLGAGDGVLTPTYKPAAAANADLGWEKTAMTNYAVDIVLFKGLLGFSIERYDSKTTDMLLEIPIPHTSGYSNARVNVGEVSNKGWEVMVSSQKKIRDFNYTFSANIGTNKNEVLKLGPNNTPFIKTGGYSRAYYITEVGQPIGCYYLLVQDGIFATTKQLSQYPHFSTTQAGDFRFVDVDKDGVLDANLDRTVVGNYMPDFTYGFSGSLGFRNIDFVFVFQGVYGNEILNLNKRYYGNMEGNQNCTTDALNRWRSEEEPGNGEINRANRKQKGYNGYTSTYHIEDGSYLRLQNISLGYTLPGNITKPAYIEKARLYISGKNLWTLTNYTGYSPEVNKRPDDALTPGEDYGTYPLDKTITFGINITF